MNIRALIPLLGLLGLLALASAAGAANSNANYHAVCPASPFVAHCHALVVDSDVGSNGSKNSGHGHGGGGGVTNPTPKPGSLTPQQFDNAYGLTSPTGSSFAWNGKTVAIVDAYNDPNIEADLGVYDTKWGLPPCTSANGCFSKVLQNGSVPTDSGWSLEISLDVEIAHAICPQCKVLLVEAASASFSNLLAAEQYATAHANAVSNSWGASEFSSETAYDSYFNVPGVAITVSSGDNGYGAEYPASSQFVTDVGGTTLTLNSDGSRLSETAWNGTGSGCSAYEPMPSWQSSKVTGCLNRAGVDVSADADPASGAAVYDSVSYSGQSGWFQVGGTSLASPLVASVFAQGPSFSNIYSAQYIWGQPAGTYFDVTSGSNGSCSVLQWCNARPGWDGPTGFGTPLSTNGF